MTAKRTYRVTVKMLREYSATTHIRASSQAEADRKALAAYYKWDGLGDFPPSWCEHEPSCHDAEIDMRFRCVDCGEDKEGEYYMGADEVWAASGLGKSDGMPCLACLEQRIGRRLVFDDFTALCPPQAAWQRHLAARTDCEPKQVEMWSTGD